MINLLKIYTNLFRIEHENNYNSFDVYDGSNLKLPGLQKLKLAQLISTYFNKFSPVNCRRCLRIKKRRYPHAIACVINAYYNYPDAATSKNEIRELVTWLVNKSLIEKYGEHCWNGLGVPMRLKGNNINPAVPGIIGTAAVGKAILSVYLKTKENKYAEILRSVRSYVKQNHYICYKDLSYLKYRPTTPDRQFTVNAAALGASLIYGINEALEEEKELKEIEEVVQTIINMQEDDGRWKYRFDFKNDSYREQIDFHQAYIILSLMEVYATGLSNINLKASIRKALKYQNKVQVMSNGQIYYRYPKKYPVNIHNQLYAYYVNKRAAEVFKDKKYDAFADKIIAWTMNNLYNEKKGFIYGLYPLKKINISYSRWGNAHALLLISELLRSEYTTK